MIQISTQRGNHSLCTSRSKAANPEPSPIRHCEASAQRPEAVLRGPTPPQDIVDDNDDDSDQSMTYVELPTAVVSLPPAYTPSPDPPTYTRQRLRNEQTLSVSCPRRCNSNNSSRTTGTGVHAKWSGKRDLGLMLFGHVQFQSSSSQESVVYGRNGRVWGCVVLGDGKKRKVEKVTIEVEGSMKMTVADGGSQRLTFLHLSKELYTTASGSQPDSELPFTLLLPPTTTSPVIDTTTTNISTYPLPPSYDIQLTGVPGLRAFVEYTCSVIVERKGRWFKNKKILSTPIIYHPRSRPPAPMLVEPFNRFIETMKASPESWRDHVAFMKTRNLHLQQHAHAGLKDVEVHLLLPSIQIYPLNTSIPFHIQLTSSHHTLSQLLHPNHPCKNSTTTTEKETSLKISISLIRQVMIKVHGQKAWQHRTIGEGKIVSTVHSPLSPSSSSSLHLSSSSPGDQDDAWAAWEGEISPCTNEDSKDSECGMLKVGSFAVGDLKVTDFIVLAISPEEPSKSPFLVHQQSVGVRLVSDPFEIGDMSDS